MKRVTCLIANREKKIISIHKNLNIRLDKMIFEKKILDKEKKLVFNIFLK